jgi:RNA polymerase sigma-70 factor (ECF subfamily)
VSGARLSASITAEVGRSAIADAQLVALARESRGEALEVMYAAYKTRIYTFLLRLLSDPEGADDLTQDVFTKAYQALGSLTKEHRVLPWLYRIATNTAIDNLRRRKRFTWLRVGLLAGTREEPLMRDEHGAIPERDQVQRVLATLPLEQSTALLLHSLEGYSYKEIAEIQSCSVTAVRSRLARARKAFRVEYATTETSRPS